MAEIIKTYRQELPAMRFIGKKYADTKHWDEWFANDWFALVEQAMGGEAVAHGLYEDGDAYIGLMSYREGEPDAYWIGEFAPVGTQAPEGFETVDFPASAVGVCWVYGKEPDVYRAVDACVARLTEQGLGRVSDETGVDWAFERYVCPRFTTPDEQGNIILDYCQFTH